MMDGNKRGGRALRIARIMALVLLMVGGAGATVQENPPSLPHQPNLTDFIQHYPNASMPFPEDFENHSMRFSTVGVPLPPHEPNLTDFIQHFPNASMPFRIESGKLPFPSRMHPENLKPELSLPKLQMDAEYKKASLILVPGKLEANGTHFELTNSSYLNITVDSSEPVKMVLESAPEMVTMRLEPASNATSTRITMGGFAPKTTYHKYEDNYHNHAPFTTDADGSYTFSQDISNIFLISVGFFFNKNARSTNII